MAGFEVTPYGRSCLTPEGSTLAVNRARSGLEWLR
jgi:hypothetical protein